MRSLFLIVGGVATAAMLLISMRLNFLFGYSLGQTYDPCTNIFSTEERPEDPDLWRDTWR